MKNVLKPLVTSVLIPLGLTSAASATDAANHKKTFGYGMTTLIISIEETNDIMRIIDSPGKSGLLIKGVSETNKNEAKEQNGGFFGMLLGALGAILLTGRGQLTSKSTIRAVQGAIRAGEGTIRAGQNS